MPTSFFAAISLLSMALSAWRGEASNDLKVSKWIVAIADPRASKDYEWGATLTAQQKAERGCYGCERPSFVTGTLGSDWYELYTAGRVIAARPERCATASPTSGCASGSLFEGTGYAYLGDPRRLENRIATVMADTVRPTHVLTAAQSAPVASGAHQETFLLHSGEMVTSAVDLDAGGRAGWNVVLDRTYRSRTLGLTALGAGWDAPMFQRLRSLPSGDVEYRDGSGETWRFTATSGPVYLSPAGFDTKLTRLGDGWRLTDAKQRVTDFDSLGRLVLEGDEFYELKPNMGNVIRYAYDAEGRLSRIVDPVGRTTTLEYDEGDQRLETIEDWRGREIVYEYDAAGNGLLTAVKLPKTRGHFAEFDYSSDSTRPKQIYTYRPGSSSMSDRLELGTNLQDIREPGDTEARVTFGYKTNGAERDMIESETWHTNDDATATFAYMVPSSASELPVSTRTVIVDALEQQRTYTLTPNPPKNYADDRVHTRTMVEAGVPVWAAATFGELPAEVRTSDTLNKEVDRTSTFNHLPAAQPESGERALSGRLNVATVDGEGSVSTTYGWTQNGITAGAVLQSINAAAPSGSLSRTFHRTGPYLDAIESGAVKVQSRELRREKTTLESSDGGVKTTIERNAFGLPRSVVSSAGGQIGAGSDEDRASGAGSVSETNYHDAADPIAHRRGLPEWVTAGTGNALRTEFKRESDPDVVVIAQPGRSPVTVEHDQLGRVIRRRTIVDGVESEEVFSYDARGRLVRHLRKQAPNHYVEDRYRYDRVGRTIEQETYEGPTNIPSTLLQRTTTEYDLPERTTTTRVHDTDGTNNVLAETVTTLDGLGRVQERATDPKNPFMGTDASDPALKLRERMRYDIDGNVVFRSDGLVAAAMRYDGAHRLLETLTSGKIRTTTQIDGFGRMTRAKNEQTGNEVTNDYTPGGKLKTTTTNLSESRFTWDGAGRTRTAMSLAGLDQPNPVTVRRYDDAGRLRHHAFGEGIENQLGRAYEETEWTYRETDLPDAIRSIERDAATTSSYLHRPTFDAAGRPKMVTTDGALDMTSRQTLDLLGNATSVKTPSKPAATEYAFDGRGLMTEEKLPDPETGAAEPANKFDYSATGVLKTYTDATTEPTETKSDGLGRPYQRIYADDSTEEIHYELTRVSKVKDRQDRWQFFRYEPETGRLQRVTNDAGDILDELSYDTAGRLISWKTKDNIIELGSFDGESRPRLTRQTRLKANGEVLDSYEQTHEYDRLGRRTRWTMPGTLPAGWTTEVYPKYDAAGNLVRLERKVDGNVSTLLEAEYRGSGRPKQRTLNVAGGLRREYEYEQAAGRLDAFRVFAGGTLMAGSEVAYSGTQLKSAKLLGLANGGLTTSWDHDQRGRLRASSAASSDPNAAASMAPRTLLPQLSDADFLEEVGVAAGAPMKTFAESKDGHKIASAGGRSFEYKKANGSEGGAVRTGDEHFFYEFDEKERLRNVTQRPSGTESVLYRVVYSYSGLGRMIGRRVEIANATGTAVLPNDAFRLATPTELGAGAELPPETTFVWDPISDQLVMAFDTATGQPLHQLLHGGMGLDDPIEETVATSGGPKRYFPIYDEAGDGNLQAILNEAGTIVTRTIVSDPYGDGVIAVSGAAVQSVTVTRGTSDDVKVDVRFTEPLDASTVSAGTRLSALTNATPPAVAATSSVAPALSADGYTVQWTLSAAQWAELSTAPGAYSLSVAATNALRATTYDDGGTLFPANTTLRSGVYATAEIPFELRETFTELASRLSSTTPYEAYTLTTFIGSVPPLSSSSTTRIATHATGDSGSSLLLAASFQAQSFTDPFTRKNLVRNRWYDPPTGTFLSPDPMGYQDSSNLYAFAGGDPVNGRDPTGMYECRGSAKDCAAIKKAWNDLSTARDNLPRRSAERAALGKVLNLLGRPDQRNGVEVSAGPSTYRDTVGGAHMSTHAAPIGPTGYTFNIEIDVKAIAAAYGGRQSSAFAPELASVLGHEAQHELDQRGFGHMVRSDTEAWATEINAYTVSAHVYRGLNFESSSGLWSRAGGYNQQAIHDAAANSVFLWLTGNF